MNNETFVDRFDRFQARAVKAISDDFEDKPNGRFLLVIPTGGGKTFTAVKSVSALFELGVLDPLQHRVLWVAHREELLTQADETFFKYEERFPDKPSFKDRVDFRMVGSLSSSILSNQNLRLAVIDEAHHSAANSYLPIFGPSHLGVLGLTATPSRHDGNPLEFERESFSIGFPDLVDMGVVLRPEVQTVDGGTYMLTSLTGDNDGFDALNNSHRNQKIINAILARQEVYKKIVIYVGTLQHVRDLHGELIRSSLRDKYQSISWVMGGGVNSRDQSRRDYFEQEKRYERSIIVNVDILTEGYDDPTVNTVVMARPTASKLVYMQSMGRAIRHDPNDDLKRAYIVEVVDVLPNIRYHIDNRWLYSDISDALEPAVVDREYSSPSNFGERLHEIYGEYAVPDTYRFIPEYQDHHRYTMLLFKVYVGGSQYCHYPILLDNENRPQVSNMFNYLSERMRSYRNRGVNSEQIFRMVDHSGIRGMENELFRSMVFGAMENAASTDEIHEAGRPWVTFVTLRLFQDESELPSAVLEFISDCINADELIDQIRGKTYLDGSYLIKYPLPLTNFVGKIVPGEEFHLIKGLVDRIVQLKEKSGNSDHRPQLREILKYSVIPIEPVYSRSLVQIVREGLDYFIELD